LPNTDAKDQKSSQPKKCNFFFAAILIPERKTEQNSIVHFLQLCFSIKILKDRALFFVSFTTTDAKYQKYCLTAKLS
jgi:hypothetical protein